MARTRLQPANLADPVRYSHGWRVGNTVHLAGALGTESDGSLAPDVRVQTRRAFEKLATVMHEAGGTPDRHRQADRVDHRHASSRWVRRGSGAILSARSAGQHTRPGRCSGDTAALMEIEGVAVLE
jgi:enamine deaminase RidA (YjgF/YER057c/UK114 family)